MAGDQGFEAIIIWQRPSVFNVKERSAMINVLFYLQEIFERLKGICRIFTK